ncbi:MAG: hypothetical protein GY856_47285 [bacterium]|nr:hypothetical protein [bacterium]
MKFERRGHSKQALVPEGWYRLRSEELGEFEVHLSPIARETRDAQQPNAPHLEALFC